MCGIVFFAFASYEWCRQPLTSLFASSFGISAALLGFIGGASTITGILLKFPAGVFSDVFGRKRVLVVGTCFFALVPLAYALVSDPWILLGVRFLHGGATAIFGPAALAIVADLFRERRAEAMGWYSAAAHTGKALGPVAMAYALVGTGDRFALTYLLAAPIGFVALLFALFIPLSMAARTSSDSVGRRIAQGFREVASEGRVIATAATDGVVMISAGALQAFLPLYAIEVCGLSKVQTGWLFGVQIVTSLLSRPLMGRVSDRIGRKPMIVGGMTLAAAAFAVLAQVRGFEILLLLAATYGLGEAIVHTSTTAFAADICQQRSLGSAMGMFGALADVGHAAGPILTGALLILLHRDFGLAFLLIGGMVLAAAALFALRLRTG